MKSRAYNGFRIAASIWFPLVDDYNPGQWRVDPHLRPPMRRRPRIMAIWNGWY